MQNTARQTSQPVASTDTHTNPRSRFLTDISTIRSRARERLADGAVTPSYGANRLKVLNLLDEALAAEIVCALRYRHHYFMVRGAAGEAIKGELMKHAREEQSHADLIAERVAIESYAQLIRFLGNDDPTTRGILEKILAEEEQHAEELVSLLGRIGGEVNAERVYRRGPIG